VLITARTAALPQRPLLPALRVSLEIPPLRERVEDIGLRLGAYATHHSEHYQIYLSPPAMKVLLEYDWPGNVREIENCVKYLTCPQLTRPVDKYDLPMIPRAASRTQLLDEELYTKPFTRGRTQLASKSKSVTSKKRCAKPEATSRARPRITASTARNCRG
jgi:transcriptional regulator with GAF, ATPase, and Fis domain